MITSILVIAVVASALLGESAGLPEQGVPSRGTRNRPVSRGTSFGGPRD